MKNRLTAVGLILFVCISFLTGCVSMREMTYDDPTIYQRDAESIEQVGVLPDAFKNIVADNVFKDVIAFNGRLLKAEAGAVDEETKTVVHRVQMMDVYGNPFAAYECSSDHVYAVTTLTATEDGGFLFVLGFGERYLADEEMWASEKGVASRVIKCDSSGKLQFDMPFDGIEEYGLEFCFEKNGQFYLFGEVETPETDALGVASPSDIYMVILDQNGKLLKSQCIAGSDYDSLDAAEITDNGFLLSISSQSEDGDFAGSNAGGYPKDWVITVNDDLEIIEKKKETGRDYFDDRIGEKDGAPVYKSDPLLDEFDAGTPTALIDYGDFYLIVSVNTTGIYENTPGYISSILVLLGNRIFGL